MDTNLSTPAPKTRSGAQAEASRLNGARSLGPITVNGKASSAANGIVHGLASTSVLLPSETREQYEANLAAWSATLKPASPGEAEIVGRVSDISFRQRRLQRLEDRHLAASLELKVQETKAWRQLKAARNALTGLAVMVETVGKLAADMPAESVKGLVSPIQGVLAMLEPLELAVQLTVPLEDVFEKLRGEAAGAVVSAEVFGVLAEVGGQVVEALKGKIVELEAEIGAERERLADDLLLGEDRELKRFERHRAMLNKALDAELARLRVVRELASASPGSSCGVFGPILVELRVVGRREA